jgi:hypothetical protein
MLISAGLIPAEITENIPKYFGFFQEKVKNSLSEKVFRDWKMSGSPIWNSPLERLSEAQESSTKQKQILSPCFLIGGIIESHRKVSERTSISVTSLCF